MENKYYIPETSEFHVGFEYERFCGGPMFQGWQKYTCDQDYCDGRENVLVLPGDSDQIRVKYLDREDIEELGWEKQETDYNGTPVFKLKDKGWYMDVDKDNNCYIHNGEAYEQNECIFYGVIKNKSELKRVMGMIKLDVA